MLRLCQLRRQIALEIMGIRNNNCFGQYPAYNINTGAKQAMRDKDVTVAVLFAKQNNLAVHIYIRMTHVRAITPLIE
ncbi:hypothetical protein D3C85_1748140 [compost metagenome]